MKHFFKALVLIGFIVIALGSETFQPRDGMTVREVDQQAAVSMNIGLVFVSLSQHPALSGVEVYETKLQRSQRDRNGALRGEPTYYLFLNGRLISKEEAMRRIAAHTPPTSTQRPNVSPSTNTPTGRSPSIFPQSAIAVAPTTPSPTSSPQLNPQTPTTNTSGTRQGSPSWVVEMQERAKSRGVDSAKWRQKSERERQERALQQAKGKDQAYIYSFQMAVTGCANLGSGMSLLDKSLTFEEPTPTQANVDTIATIKVTPDSSGTLTVMEIVKSSGYSNFDDMAKRRVAFCIPWSLKRNPEYQQYLKSAEKLEIVVPVPMYDYNVRDNKHDLSNCRRNVGFWQCVPRS